METRLVGTNHIPSPLAEDESRPLVFNRELRDVSLPREANSLGPERPVFLTDVPTDVPVEARPEDENRVQVATLDDFPECEKRRRCYDAHAGDAGRIASVRRVPTAQGCGESIWSGGGCGRRDGPWAAEKRPLSRLPALHFAVRRA